MAKRKLTNEPDRKFVQENQWSEVTETICVEIKNFTEKIDDLDKKKKPIDSPKFKLAGKELYVCVYPEDYREDSLQFIAVYLTNYSKESIIASASFKSSSGGNFSFPKKLVNAKSGLGSFNFLSHAVYKKWARENQDIFSLEVTVTLHVKSPSTWTTERIKPKLMLDPILEASMSWDNNNQEDFTDFAILSQEGTRFPCHRLILASQSPPLKAMMIRDTKEKQEGQVQLQFKEEVVKGFVSFFYSRKVSQEIIEEHLEDFLTLADRYDVAPLKLQVEESAVKLLTTENMVDMFYLGDLYRATQLKAASEFLMSRNKDILKEMDLSRPLSSPPFSKPSAKEALRSSCLLLISRWFYFVLKSLSE